MLTFIRIFECIGIYGIIGYALYNAHKNNINNTADGKYLITINDVPVKKLEKIFPNIPCNEWGKGKTENNCHDVQVVIKNRTQAQKFEKHLESILGDEKSI